MFNTKKEKYINTLLVFTVLFFVLILKNIIGEEKLPLFTGK